MEAVTTVGEAFFSTMFKALLDKFTASDLINFARKEKLYIELKKWKKILLGINAVLTDAEEKQVTNRTVKLWLTDLRDLAYDIEEVLDAFAYEACRCKLREQPRTNSSKSKKLLPACLNGLKPGAFTFRVKMGSKIKAITARLQEIAKQKSDLDLRENVGGTAHKARDQRQPTTSLVNEVNVFGRKKDREALVKLLLVDKPSDDAQVLVIPITGMGGIGKTTVAQLVYNDDRVTNFFNLKAWIHVSEDFDVINVTKSILQAISITPGISDISYDLNLLHVKLKDELSGKKFLLVLDDVWHENSEAWSLLMRPFEVGNSGSKIIITTRDQNVSQTTGTMPAYPLKELAYEDCLSVLAWHALGSKNFDRHPHLKEIGEEIVRKCKGLPLAIKTLAGLLRAKPDYKDWKAVSRSKMWDLTEERGAIFPALRLSYHHLPSHLKPCFAYCSLFPKDYEFDRDKLVLLWIAAGFMQPKGNMPMEDLGRKYFSDLLSRSFFQQSNNNESLFVMHDFINDLAQSVSGDLCFNMEHELQSDDLEKARHVSFIQHQYDVSQRFEVLNKTKCVRSLLALPVTTYQSKYCYLSFDVSHQLLPKLKCLRVLSLSGYFIEELSNSIGNLKHLRYLNLSKTAITLLPESVCNLHHLHTLILNQCTKLTALPVRMDRLIKLQQLDISDTPKLQEMPSGLRNLTSLRVLPKFIIGKAGWGLTLRDLKDLSLLQGQLSILRLHNVVDIQDARVANLKQKRELKDLALEWSNDIKLISTNRHDQMRILEFLQPPKDLQCLSISYYGAANFPSWVMNPSFSKIVQIDISDCTNCASLPSLGQLPLLRNLNIKGMHAVTRLGPQFYGQVSHSLKAFPSLELLRFENMTEWKEWISSADNIEAFPLLRELILHNCPKLTGKLPRQLCSLVKLDVQNCPQVTNSPLTFSSLGELNIEDNSVVILQIMVDQSFITKLNLKRILGFSCLTKELTKALVKLEVLEIESCSELMFLWQNGSETQNMMHWLKTLVVKNCPELVSLVRENQGVSCFSSLKDLRIENCPKFVSFPPTALPHTLKSLAIKNCEALESLPDMFEMNVCNNQLWVLEELEIVRCCSLKSFPNGMLPSTLKKLSIANCRDLQCLPTLMQKLTSLRELSLSECVTELCLPPNIASLELRNCKNLCQPMSEWGLDKLNCLTEIKIVGPCPAADMVSFPDDEGLMLPSKLTNLCMGNLNKLESLSRGLQNLAALEELQVKGCCKLRNLPKTGLPTTLGRLCISGCPGLKDKCMKERGEYWHIIANIPCLEIN